MPEREAPGVGVIEEETEEIAEDLPWCIIIYNDDVHTFDAVVLQVQKATGASLEEAHKITTEVHETGQAICFVGDLETCQRVANILKEIDLSVSIQPYFARE